MLSWTKSDHYIVIDADATAGPILPGMGQIPEPVPEDHNTSGTYK